MRIAIYSFIFGWIYKRLAQAIYRIRRGQDQKHRYILGDGFQVVALLGAAFLFLRRYSLVKTLALLPVLLHPPRNAEADEPTETVSATY